MSVARALVAELASDPRALEELQRLVAPLIEARMAEASPLPDAWLDSKGAAHYLGISTNALHKHTSARTIPFQQDTPGGKCWFKKRELDAWRTRR